METEEPNSMISQEKRNEYHEKFDDAILQNLTDTPLVLKGGTALYLGYGLNRFSEDLDFDSSKKLNLINKIKEATPNGFKIDHIHVKKDTDTVSRYMIQYSVPEIHLHDALKMEVSYRTPVPENQITVKNGIRFSSVERIVDNKLNAAFDGDNTRTKARDLFDLHYLAKCFPNQFDADLAQRLQAFSQDPDQLVSAYETDAERDPLLINTDLDTMTLELNEMANQIVLFYQVKQNHQTQQHLLTLEQKQVLAAFEQSVHTLPPNIQMQVRMNLYQNQLDEIQQRQAQNPPQDEPEIDR